MIFNHEPLATANIFDCHRVMTASGEVNLRTGDAYALTLQRENAEEQAKALLECQNSTH